MRHNPKRCCAVVKRQGPFKGYSESGQCKNRHTVQVNGRHYCAAHAKKEVLP